MSREETPQREVVVDACGCEIPPPATGGGDVEEPVTGLQAHLPDVDLDEVAVADRAGDHVLEARLLGLLGRQHGAIGLFGDELGGFGIRLNEGHGNRCLLYTSPSPRD